MEKNAPAKSWLALFTLEFMLAVLLLLLSASVFGFIAHYCITVRDQNNFDHRIYILLTQHAGPALTRQVQRITFLGSGTVLAPAYLLIALILLLQKRKQLAAALIAIAGSSMLLNVILKNIYQRSRPALAHLDAVQGYSFPSGHSMGAFTFCGLIIFVIWKSRVPRWLQLISAILLSLLAILIGCSRIYLGVHFASDVLAGFFVTVLWLSLCFMLWQLAKHRHWV
ncbi:phosphatase PAP2 family protein [Deminuibacter soli]|uniref:PAP2 family protein n=1 Tax=Deminuibacter soli TaxID=2291815 RepID=A0A3E1NGE9_9BACT|nr:phosphatase PAP2 family protein [Deminuibacter soli]RFM27040.1 PAP2 family protein [Deminuibacter soli]